jgi:hypothetical protein
MIVKVVDPGSKDVNKETGIDGKRTWIYDNLERVVISGPYEGTPDVAENEDVRLVCGLSQQCCATPEFYRIGCLDRKNNEFALFSGYEAFIMNDEGKTIEILRI